MGALKDAIEALLATLQPAPAEGRTSANYPPMPLATLYQLLRLKGIAVIGAPETAFSIYDQAQGVVRVYVSERQQVDVVPYEVVLYQALADVQAAGGSFMVCGDDVVCVLEDVLAHGTSYGDAALRALYMVSQGEKPPLAGDMPFSPEN
ncbi:MAG: hypothetical protein D3M94_07780 [Rhodocyclales bacterium GT-UBC]|nr:MAG: hypothetical protein D3M94_07780 [Rhodocyclales bacterium GT-UBC]